MCRERGREREREKETGRETEKRKKEGENLLFKKAPSLNNGRLSS